MRKSRATEGPRIGEFFLKMRKGIWQIARYDPASRQTRCISTGEVDLERAEVKLAEHALRKGKPEERDDVLLADALSFYWLERGQYLASEDSHVVAMRYALEVWGEGCMVSELTQSKQLEFIRTMRATKTVRGTLMTDSSILRFLQCVWASLNYYHADGRLKIVPPRVGNDKWNPVLTKRKRVLSLKELAKLLNVAARLEHRWRYMLLQIATGARPSALLQATDKQWEPDAGIFHLNPEGRAQNKKRRPSLPLGPTLRTWMEEWTKVPGPLCGYNGEHMTSDTYFDNIVEEAGVSCCRYDIRHTLITWLVRRGVPTDEREIYIGHRLPGSATTEGYVHLDPTYLAKAASAVEELFQALAPLVTARPLVLELLDEQPVPADVVGEVDDILKRLGVGA